VIRLSVPGRLEYRDVVLRVASSACKLTRPESERADDFDNEVVSAFGEAFNNLCIHGYRACEGDVEVEIDVGPGRITLRVMDTGPAFDPTSAPGLAVGALHESGMGIYIMRSFMEMAYRPGRPNVLTLTKRRAEGVSAAEPEAKTP
jgi:serine/threonine-protein kinase RsbW